MMYGWRLRRFRPVAVGYFVLVCFSAVYLNHHYLIDIFVGLAIALPVMAGARLLFGALYPEDIAQRASMVEQPVRT